MVPAQRRSRPIPTPPVTTKAPLVHNSHAALNAESARAIVVAPPAATVNWGVPPTIALMRENPLVAVESMESSALSKVPAEFVSVSVLVAVPVSVMLAPPVVTVSRPDAATENFGDPPATPALINEKPDVKVPVSKLSNAPENVPLPCS
ncbi:hypothetical protein GQ600_22070 [Phytophthora cactorum]|nr:hypothetical protein GQ600_22070 [Phytophthora cactorum]